MRVPPRTSLVCLCGNDSLVRLYVALPFLLLVLLASSSLAVEIEYGEVVHGVIATGGEVDTYEFQGIAGNAVWVRVKPSGAFDCALGLYGEDPDPVMETESCCGYLTELAQVVLPSTGPYRIVVRESEEDDTCSYWLMLESAGHARAMAPSLDHDSVVTGSISEGIELTPHVFQGIAGDLVTLRHHPMADLWSRVLLIAPGDSVIGEIEDVNNAWMATLRDPPLPETGEYLVLVSGTHGDRPGDYLLSYRSLSADRQTAVPVTHDAAISDSIAPPMDLDAFRFDGQAGDAVFVRFKPKGWFGSYLELVSPGDSVVAVAEGGRMEPSDLAWIRLPESGPYLLRVSEGENLADTSFGYWLGFQSMAEARSNSPAIGFGESVFDSISPITDWDSYVLTADSGEVVTVEMVIAGWFSDGIANPTIILVAPDDSVIASTEDELTGGDNSHLVLEDIVLPRTGEYLLLVGDLEGQTQYTWEYMLTPRLAETLHLSLGAWHSFSISDTSGSRIRFSADVPESDGLLVLVKKKCIGNFYSGIYGQASWLSDLSISRSGTTVCEVSGTGDHAMDLGRVWAGTYVISLRSELGFGSGMIKVCQAVDSLVFGLPGEGSLLRPFGSDWKQIEVPDGVSALFVQAQGLGPWITVDVFRDSLGDWSNHWLCSLFPLDGLLECRIDEPAPGIYYLRCSDSWEYAGFQDQFVNYTILVDSVEIEQPVITGPKIASLSTYRGGQASPVSVVVTGCGLDSGAGVLLLREDYANVVPLSVERNAAGSQLTTIFDLSGAATGDWTLRVVNPDGRSADCSRSFVVEPNGEADIWMQLAAPRLALSGRPFQVTARVGNAGTVDAYPAFVALELQEYLSCVMIESDDGLLVWPNSGYGGMSPDTATTGTLVFGLPVVRAGQTREAVVTLMPTLPPLPTMPSGEKAIPLAVIAGKIAWGVVKDQAMDYLGEVLAAKTVEFGGKLDNWSQVKQVFRIGLDRYIDGWQKKTTWKGACLFYSEWTEVAEIELKAVGMTTAARAFKGIAGVASLAISDSPYKMWENLEETFGITPASKSYTQVVWSIDPQDKIGPSGHDDAAESTALLKRHVQGDRPFEYRITFWNHADATAPAQEVVVVDTLDADFADSTFAFTEFGFLRWTVPIPGGQYFEIDVDMRPDFELITHVTGRYDPMSREVRWHFRSLDPATGGLPADPLLGFLPPIGESGYETVWIDYRVEPKRGLPTGTEITNLAYIRFDVGPWETAPKSGPFMNTIDDGAPHSSVGSLPDTVAGAAITLTVTGQDDDAGSGVSHYSIYVSRDDSTFVRWNDCASGSEMFTGALGHKYAFYSVAVDNVGNREAAPAEADATTVLVPPAKTIVGPNPFVPSRGHQRITFSGSFVGGATIRLFNQAGELVQTLHAEGGTQSIEWDGRSRSGDTVASGVYVWVLDSPTRNGEKGKIAIIR